MILYARRCDKVGETLEYHPRKSATVADLKRINKIDWDGKERWCVSKGCGLNCAPDILEAQAQYFRLLFRFARI